MRPVLLAFDTSSERLTLALSLGERVLKRRAPPAAGQDDQLPREAEKLLKSARLRLQDVDAFVAPTGPGRFTGIRVGLTYAIILAKALEKQAIGISWLEACAWSVAGPGQLVAVLPGWRGEFFFQVFSRVEGRPAPLHPPRWSDPSGLARAIEADIGSAEFRLIGPAALEALKLLPGSALAETGEATLDAASLLPAARAYLASGQIPEPAPLYIKPAHYER